MEKFFGRGRGKGSPYLLPLAKWGFRGKVRGRERSWGRREEKDGQWERRASGAAGSACPPLQICLALPSSLSSSALRSSDANWLGSSPPSRLAPLSGSSSPFLPSRPSPPFNLSLPPSLLSLLVIKENSSWPNLTSNAVPRTPPPPLSLALRGPLPPPGSACQGPWIGEPTKSRFLCIPSNFAPCNVSCQNTTLQFRLLQNSSYHSWPCIECRSRTHG